MTSDRELLWHMRTAVEGVWAERAYLLTWPMYRERIHWIDDGSVEPRALACWVHEGVAKCTRREWPDCGISLPCGFPCFRGTWSDVR